MNSASMCVLCQAGCQFSGWIADKDRIGERVTVSGPLGKFLLDETDDAIVCIAGGSGMSAIKALLEQACRK